jgi:hypothetical protein
MRDVLKKFEELGAMESQERTIGSLHLEKGLNIYFIDRSSPPVAGRCQVRLLIRVPVEPIEDYFRNCPEPSQALSRFISLAGPGPVEFQTVRIRNFIDSKDVEKTLDELKNDFIRSSLEYLKKPGFVANFIVKRYEELCEKAALRRAYDEALTKAQGE